MSACKRTAVARLARGGARHGGCRVGRWRARDIFHRKCANCTTHGCNNGRSSCPNQSGKEHTSLHVITAGTPPSRAEQSRGEPLIKSRQNTPKIFRTTLDFLQRNNRLTLISLLVGQTLSDITINHPSQGTPYPSPPATSQLYKNVLGENPLPFPNLSTKIFIFVIIEEGCIILSITISLLWLSLVLVRLAPL